MRFLSSKQKWLAVAVIIIALFAVFWFRLSVKEIPLSIIIEYNNLPEGLIVVAPPTKVIEIVIRGPKSKIKKIKKMSKTSPFTFDLDLSNAEIGMNAFPVKLEDVAFPKGIKVLRSNLSILIVKVDRKIEKDFPVQVVISGKPGPGFVIADSVMEPSHVILSGPETIINSMTAIKTKPIDISGVKDSLKKTVMLDLIEDVQLVLPQENFVTSIYIEEKIIVKAFDQIPVEGKNTKYIFSINPLGLDLKLKGPQNILDKLSAGNGLEVFIDLADEKPGIYVRYATIRTPVGITLVYVKPEIFTVDILE